MNDILGTPDSTILRFQRDTYRGTLLDRYQKRRLISQHLKHVPNLEERIWDLAIQTRDLQAEMQVRKETCRNLDDILAANYPFTLQPYSARRQEIQELQQSFVQIAYNAYIRLLTLRDFAEELELQARYEEPELLHDALLVEQAVLDATSDTLELSETYEDSGPIIKRTRKIGVFTEDRPEVLDGSSFQKVPIGRKLDSSIEVGSYDGNLENEMHPLLGPVQDCLRETNAIRNEHRIYDFEHERLEQVRVEMSRRNSGSSAFESYMDVVKKLLKQCLDFQQKGRVCLAHLKEVNQDYKAGVPSADLDKALCWCDLSSRESCENNSRVITILQGLVRKGMYGKGHNVPHWHKLSLIQVLQNLQPLKSEQS